MGSASSPHRPSPNRSQSSWLPWVCRLNERPGGCGRKPKVVPAARGHHVGLWLLRLCGAAPRGLGRGRRPEVMSVAWTEGAGGSRPRGGSFFQALRPSSSSTGFGACRRTGSLDICPCPSWCPLRDSVSSCAPTSPGIRYLCAGGWDLGGSCTEHRGRRTGGFSSGPGTCRVRCPGGEWSPGPRPGAFLPSPWPPPASAHTPAVPARPARGFLGATSTLQRVSPSGPDRQSSLPPTEAGGGPRSPHLKQVTQVTE